MLSIIGLHYYKTIKSSHLAVKNTIDQGAFLSPKNLFQLLFNDYIITFLSE